jgi:uncharacterized membrane-anchored protein
MIKYIRHIVLFAVLLLTLIIVNVQISKKERTLAGGRIMLLELAPVDPRSLMQGDYMVLRYRAADTGRGDSIPRDGTLVVSLDENNIATFRRIYSPGETLASGEHLLRYRKRGRGVRLGAESFFFQEGHARYYSSAKYGELRVTETGDSVLAGLRGQNLERLGPEPDKS